MEGLEMHRLMLVLLAAAVAPSFSPGPGTPVQPGSVFIRPGAVAPAPPPVAPPSVADQLGRIAASLEILGNGGGVTGPLGRNCVEARERMHWSTMPCSPDHLPPLPLVPVEEPYGAR
jgi:hypothetical protein